MYINWKKMMKKKKQDGYHIDAIEALIDLNRKIMSENGARSRGAVISGTGTTRKPEGDSGAENTHPETSFLTIAKFPPATQKMWRTVDDVYPEVTRTEEEKRLEYLINGQHPWSKYFL
ncbi:hypothetical protein G6011_07143 [Alternaria panax]|uniref:Uncharacterized protein n=1 Tax=Alternaria panax TaxID=48097 RepID=A0AAD4F967_9PLEO|nr:hypothetical protein G6011_07143 [Alternaria panax]